MKSGISQSLAAGQYPPRSWQHYLRAGQKCLATGRSEDALPPLLAANRLHPGHAPVLQSLGAAFLRTGAPDLALAWFDQLLSLNPVDGRALHGRGLALHALMDGPAALAAFRQSVACQPDAWQSWGSLADITPDEDERIGAIQCAADARLRLCGSGQNRPRNSADCAKALLDARRGHEAVAFIRRNAAKFGNEGAAHDQLARAFYETGNYHAALKHKRSALSLGQHDFSGSPLPPPFSPDAAARALCAIAEILDAAGIRYFLAAGTLLGFHRSGAPLVHDRDIDVGVLADESGGPDLARVIREHPGLLLDRRARPGDRYFALTFQAIAVDIFLYEPCDGGLQCGLGRLAGDVAWRFTSFGIRAADFQGRTWPIPDDPERYLTETYGPGWQTPDTGFASALSSPALFEVDPYVRAYYALSRAHTCRRMGDPAKARALLRQSPVCVDLPGQYEAFPSTDNDAEDA
jgi:tetratricopeptide (TPR) repeat protein